MTSTTPQDGGRPVADVARALGTSAPCNSEDDEQPEMRHQEIERLLKVPGPHNILPHYEVDIQEKWSLRTWIFEVLFASWIIVFTDVHEGSVLNEEEKNQFKADLGIPIPWLRQRCPGCVSRCLLQSSSTEEEHPDEESANKEKNPDEESANKEKNPDEESADKEKRVVLWKTVVNILVFLVNFYTLFIHNLITMWDKGGNTCKVIFAKPSKLPAMELVLLIMYCIIPIMIAKGIKFVWENDSFDVLKQWDNLIRGKCGDGRVYRHMKEKIKWKTLMSFLFSLLCFLIGLAGAICAIFFLCPPESNAYTAVLFMGVLVFGVSGQVALIAPYNMIRMYTTFILTRIAVFQAELKGDLEKFDDSMKEAKETADKKIELKMEESVSKDDLKIIEDRVSFLRVKRFKAVLELDDRMRDRYVDTQKMFQDMIDVNRRVEGFVTFGLRWLSVVGVAVLMYIIFYILSFLESIWPKLNKPPEPTDSPSITVHSFIEDLEGLPDHDQAGLFFFVVLIAILLFNIVYIGKILLLFANQADAWDKITSFCQSRMTLGSDDYNCGSDFEKLGRFIKSSTSAFSWMFLVKGQSITAVQFVRKKVQKEVVGSVTAIIIAAFYANGSNENIWPHLNTPMPSSVPSIFLSSAPSFQPSVFPLPAPSFKPSE